MNRRLFTFPAAILMVALASLDVCRAQEPKTATAEPVVTITPSALATPPPPLPTGVAQSGRIKRATAAPVRRTTPPANAPAAPAVPAEAAPTNAAEAAGEFLMEAAVPVLEQQADAAPHDDDNGDDNGGQIIPAPVLLSYREVKDNFGKRIADTYVVVQVNIKNPDIEHQFLLQDLRIVFDPNQCEQAQEFYAGFDVADCQAQYQKYLKYPIAYAPVAQPALQAVATIGQHHNPRNFAFRLLDFAANMGGALTGFNFIGRDGKAGLSVFNGTFLSGSKAFIPDLTAGQLTQLAEQSYRPNTLVESKDTKTYDVFIPTNQLFSKETWKLYKQDVGKSSAEAIEMRRLLQLVVTATASGTHVSKVEGDNGTTATGGGAPIPE